VAKVERMDRSTVVRSPEFHMISNSPIVYVHLQFAESVFWITKPRLACRRKKSLQGFPIPVNCIEWIYLYRCTFRAHKIISVFMSFLNYILNILYLIIFNFIIIYKNLI